MIEIEDKGEYYQLNSKRLEEGNLSFLEKRAFVVEAREVLLSCNKPCVAYTKIDNAKMIRMFAKFGGQPYKINTDYDSIWFVWR